MREKNPLRIARSRLDAAFLCEKMREGEAERWILRSLADNLRAGEVGEAKEEVEEARGGELGCE